MRPINQFAMLISFNFFPTSFCGEAAKRSLGISKQDQNENRVDTKILLLAFVGWCPAVQIRAMGALYTCYYGYNKLLLHNIFYVLQNILNRHNLILILLRLFQQL